MAKQVLNNGETHGVIRGKANDNFTELYNSKTEFDAHLADNAAHFIRNGGFVTGAINFDTITANRLFQLITVSEGTNPPPGLSYGILLYLVTDGGYKVQISFNTVSQAMHIRTYGTSWGAWVEK